MLKYQKREDYKGFKRAADTFYKNLCMAVYDVNLAQDERQKSKAELKLKEIYENIRNSRLYNERDGLYCTILEDVYRNTKE